MMWPGRTRVRAVASLAACVAVLAAFARPSAALPSNSQIRLPRRHMFADMDGDGRDDFVVLDGLDVFVARARVDFQGMASYKSAEPVRRAFAGPFSGESGAADTLCLATGDGAEAARHALQCFEMSARGARTGMKAERTLRAITAEVRGALKDGEETVVVRLGASLGRAQVLAYDPRSGHFRLLRYPTFAEVPEDEFSLAALNARAHAGAQVRAGNFVPGRDADDVAVVSADGTVTVYANDGGALKRREPGAARVPAGGTVAAARVGRPGERDRLLVRVVGGGGGASGAVIRVYSLEGGRLAASPRATGRLSGAAPGADVFYFAAGGGGVGAAAHTMGVWRVFVPGTGGEASWLPEYTQDVAAMDGDPDGDGLLTRVELGAKEGVPLYAYGASPFAPDVFLYVASMENKEHELDCAVPARALALAKREMAWGGINLHVETGRAAWSERLGSSERKDFSWNSPQARNLFRELPQKWRGIFKLGVSAFEFCLHGVCDFTGYADEIPGSTFLMTVCSYDFEAGRETEMAYAGTLLHELGHTLGLKHGGVDMVSGKPNHPSIMSHALQFSGVKIKGKERLVFADWACDDLDERNLDERKGIRCSSSRRDMSVVETYDRDEGLSGRKRVPVNGKADFNNDGRFSMFTVQRDLDGDGRRTLLRGTRNEYDAIDLVGGGRYEIGSAIRGIKNRRPPWPEASPAGGPFSGVGRDTYAAVNTPNAGRRARDPAEGKRAAQFAAAHEVRTVQLASVGLSTAAASQDDPNLDTPAHEMQVLPPDVVVASSARRGGHAAVFPAASEAALTDEQLMLAVVPTEPGATRASTVLGGPGLGATEAGSRRRKVGHGSEQGTMTA